MKVRATDGFQLNQVIPHELDHVPEEGEVFDVTQERFKVLNGENKYGVTFVEKEVKKAVKKKTTK